MILSSAAFGPATSAPADRLGFADPAAGFSPFASTMNQMGPGLLLNARGQKLVDAAYLSMGFKNKEGGVWVR